MDPIKITKKLIEFKTITPNDEGIMDYISALLRELNFEKTIIKNFTDINKKAKDTKNLYSSLFNEAKGKNLCFAGHVDVVNEGKEYLWRFPPFEPTIEDGILYGRGATDMKTAIACFIAACKEFLEENKNFNTGNISLLLTCDEEGNAINGTIKMLKFLSSQNIKLDDVIVGEPTSEKILGDTVKVGRRGSVSFNLEITGVSGHVAYPHLAKNPISTLINIMAMLKNLKLDEANQFFEASNLEIVKIGPENGLLNVIPDSAHCSFNVRFSNFYTGETLVKKITEEIEKICNLPFKLNSYISGESFINPNTPISQILANSIKKILHIETKFSTSGGTSDARFIKDYANVAELGTLNATAHKIDECILVEDIINLTKIYKEAIKEYFEL